MMFRYFLYTVACLVATFFLMKEYVYHSNPSLLLLGLTLWVAAIVNGYLAWLFFKNRGKKVVDGRFV